MNGLVKNLIFHMVVTNSQVSWHHTAGGYPSTHFKFDKLKSCVLNVSGASGQVPKLSSEFRTFHLNFQQIEEDKETVKCLHLDVLG